jgi:Zn-finger nucleic acid-binding protein
MSHDDPYRSQRPPPSSLRTSGRVRCPGCLAEVEDSLRRCTKCGTPIATVRCGGCYHMNVPEAALCSACGRELGLEPLGEPDDLSCPDCKQRFQAFSGQPGVLRDCVACGGQFVEHALLEDLLRERELYGAAPRRPPRQNPLDNPVRYVPCPCCGEIMNRKNFGRSSGVIVDVCRAHGVWFDRGELPRVLAFVEAGGLAELKKREAEESARSVRDERVRQFRESLEPVSMASRWESKVHGREMSDASLTLLGIVADLLD